MSLTQGILEMHWKRWIKWLKGLAKSWVTRRWTLTQTPEISQLQNKFRHMPRRLGLFIEPAQASSNSSYKLHLLLRIRADQPTKTFWQNILALCTGKYLLSAHWCSLIRAAEMYVADNLWCRLSKIWLSHYSISTVSVYPPSLCPSPALCLKTWIHSGGKLQQH